MPATSSKPPWHANSVCHWGLAINWLPASIGPRDGALANRWQTGSLLQMSHFLRISEYSPTIGSTHGADVLIRGPRCLCLPRRLVFISPSCGDRCGFFRPRRLIAHTMFYKRVVEYAPIPEGGPHQAASEECWKYTCFITTYQAVKWPNGQGLLKGKSSERSLPTKLLGCREVG